MKRVFVITGPIGAGKSTITPTINKRFDLDTIEHVNRDALMINKYSYLNDDYIKRNELAKQDAVKRLEECINEGKDLVWETVIAKQNRIDLLRRFKDAQYYITVFFVSVSDADVCIKRVNERQKAMGYEIPEEKVIKKYRDSYVFLKEVEKYADELWIVDNNRENKEAKIERREKWQK